MLEKLLNSSKTLKLWQVWVLTAVLLGAAGAVYGVYESVGDSGGPGLGKNQQLIQVRPGNLVNQVSTNGNIIFPNKETLTFDTPGTVGEVMVEEGERVVEGHALAKLDQTTVVSLEKEVAQARVKLEEAKDALEEAQDPHTPIDIARAEANVADAALALQNAQDVLDSLLEPPDGDIAQAEVKLANSRLSLRNTQDALDRLLKPTSGDIAQAEVTVASAKISVQHAQEVVDANESGPSPEDVAQDQSQIDSARTAWENAQRDIKLDQKEWDDKRQAAQDRSDPSVEDYRDVYLGWLGIDLFEDEVDLDPGTLLDSWSVELNSLFDRASRFQDSSLGVFSDGPPRDDPATRWNEFTVYVWMNLTPGDLVPTCEDTVVTAGTLCVKGEIDATWDALASAVDNLDTVETQAEKAIASARDRLLRTAESLAAAEDALADLKAGPDPLEIEANRKGLALAEANLDAAKARVAELTVESKATEVDADLPPVIVPG